MHQIRMLDENRVQGRPTLREFLLLEMGRRGIESSHKLGECLRVSQGTAWRLLNDTVIPRESTLVKVSRAFGVSITEVRRMARRSAGELDPFEWPEEFDQLPRRMRVALVEVGRAALDMAADRVSRNP